MAGAEGFRAPVQVFDVKVDSYIDQDLSGRLRREGSAGETPFRGALQLILLIDEALAGESCLDDGVRWAPAPELPPVRAGAPAKTATLEIELLFRENSSWQGRMTWLEENRRATFRSVLELLRMLDEALAE